MNLGAHHKIQELLENMRPFIQADGGDIQFVAYQDGVVTVRLLGACVSCPMSLYTLKSGILERLQQELPEVLDIINVE